jgi:hypothetical protein
VSRILNRMGSALKALSLPLIAYKCSHLHPPPCFSFPSLPIATIVDDRACMARYARREVKVATTYKPGDTVPRTGEVQCTQHNNTQDNVKEGTKFAPCMHWGDHDRKECTWQYI